MKDDPVRDSPDTILFFPGASGSADFWRPAARSAGLEGQFFAWPGLGVEPPYVEVNGFDDLPALCGDAACGIDSRRTSARRLRRHA